MFLFDAVRSFLRQGTHSADRISPLSHSWTYPGSVLLAIISLASLSSPCFAVALAQEQPSPTRALAVGRTIDQTVAQSSSGIETQTGPGRIELSDLTLQVDVDPAPHLSKVRQIGVITTLTNRTAQSIPITAVDISTRAQALLADALQEPPTDREFQRGDVTVQVLNAPKIEQPGSPTALVLKCVVANAEVLPHSPIPILTCATLLDDVGFNNQVFAGSIDGRNGLFSIAISPDFHQLSASLNATLSDFTAAIASAIRQYPAAPTSTVSASPPARGGFSPNLFGEVADANVTIYPLYQTRRLRHQDDLRVLASQLLTSALRAPASSQERPRFDIEVTDKGWRGVTRLRAVFSIKVQEEQSAYGAMALFSAVLRYELIHKQGTTTEYYFFLTEPMVFAVPQRDDEYEESVRKVLEAQIEIPARMIRQNSHLQ